MEEIWKPVVGYAGSYEVSNLGRVKSVFRIIQKKNWKQTIKEKVLVASKNNKGYFYVDLYRKCKRKRYLIHRLVAGAFLNDFNSLNKKGLIVDHIDQNPRNNCVNNLRMCTMSQNLMNMGLATKRKSKGVHKTDKKWTAKIMKNYKNILIGRFEKREDAILAYQQKAKEIYGEYADNNFFIE